MLAVIILTVSIAMCMAMSRRIAKNKSNTCTPAEDHVYQADIEFTHNMAYGSTVPVKDTNCIPMTPNESYSTTPPSVDNLYASLMVEGEEEPDEHEPPIEFTSLVYDYIDPQDIS
jgi:hypothetical protein